MAQHPIKDGTACVLIIEPQGSRRVLISNVLRGLKFSQIVSVDHVKEAISILENDSHPVDWIITGLFPGAPYNGMHLLGTCLNKPELRDIRISFFLEQEEQFCVADAFALGLFSFHHKHATIGGLTQELQALISTGAVQDWNDHEISAHYLRNHLKQSRLFDSLLRLERQILTNVPGKISYILNYAEALVLNGQGHSAEPILAKLSPVHPTDRARIQELLNHIQAGAKEQSGGSSYLPASHLQNVVVIDPDESTLNSVEEALRLVGVRQIQKFTQAKEALTHIKQNPEPDLIIQEWRLGDYAGPALFQAIRQHGFVNTGIIIYSALVKNSDRPLLREIGVTDVIEKPKSARVLAGMITGLARSEYSSKDVAQLEKRIRLMLGVKNLKAAKELYDKLLKKNPPARIKDSLAAEFAYFQDDMREAAETAVQVLHTHGEDVCVLNLLGKIYMKQGLFAQAIYYFDRADDLAPSNIERLCNLAVAQASSGESDTAEKSLAKARGLAGDEFIVDEAEVKLGLINGQVERAKSFMESYRRSSDLIAFVNNRGVWLATQGRVQDGIGLYVTALKSLTANLMEIAPTISYNLALAHVRNGDTKQANQIVRYISDAPSPGLWAKVRSLQTKIERALDHGTDVALNEQPRAPKKPRIERFDQMPWLGQDIAAGSARLFGIFVPGDPVNPDVMKMFEVLSFPDEDMAIVPRRRTPPKAG